MLCVSRLRNEYAFILMDINMSTIDGIEATIMIRALEDPGYAIPIVAMTAETAIDRIEGHGRGRHEWFARKAIWTSSILQGYAPWIG